MANNYYDMTGALSLKEITPVINALFGAFEVQECGDDKAYIKHNEDNRTSYEAVAESIAEEFGFEADNFVLAVLAMAEKLGKGDKVLEVLGEDAAFDEEESADLHLLYNLAQIMDDGHGLTSLWAEAAWTCDKPRLGEFGGYGEFCGKYYVCNGSSIRAIQLGQAIEKSLASGDIEKVAQTLAHQLVTMLNGIRDDGPRQQAGARLAEMIQAQMVSAPDAGAISRSEIGEVMMSDIVGNYDVPGTVPEWGWVEKNASYSHVDNGDDAVWEFVLNLALDFDDIPEKLAPVIAQAREAKLAYLGFHQGT